MSLAATLQLQLGSLDLQAELDVRPGELLALLGPNGAGKSTVLRCLAGLAPITAGRIAIDDIVVDEPATHSFVEPEHRSIGVVFQDYLLFEHMTVLENVAYGLRARRQPKATAHRVARGWMERVGLGEYCDQRPRALSGGQAQRAVVGQLPQRARGDLVHNDDGCVIGRCVHCLRSVGSAAINASASAPSKKASSAAIVVAGTPS